MSTKIIKNKNGMVFLIPDETLEHVKQHNQPGFGSYFTKDISINNVLDDIKEHFQNINNYHSGQTMYSTEINKIIGYNCIVPTDMTEDNGLSIDNLPRVTKKMEDYITYKPEGSGLSKKFVPVGLVQSYEEEKEFATNQLTSVVMKTTDTEILPDDVKNNSEILKALSENNLATIVSFFPGRSHINGIEIPPASQWNGQYQVVIPAGYEVENIINPDSSAPPIMLAEDALYKAKSPEEKKQICIATPFVDNEVKKALSNGNPFAISQMVSYGYFFRPETIQAVKTDYWNMEREDEDDAAIREEERKNDLVNDMTTKMLFSNPSQNMAEKLNKFRETHPEISTSKSMKM